MVTLFSRIADLENHIAHEILTKGDDYAKYQHRVGIANIFNPFRADVRYSLNLKVKDERAVAGKQAQLNANTPIRAVVPLEQFVRARAWLCLWLCCELRVCGECACVCVCPAQPCLSK
jgi:hypothetical protein